MTKILQHYLSKYFPQNNIDSDFNKSIVKLFKDDSVVTYFKQKYHKKHEIQSDKQLYKYVYELKNKYLKKSNPINKILYDKSILFKSQALGTHTYKYINHGKKTLKKNEIRVAISFKNFPIEFLKHIVIHELAHLKEKEHNKAFYRLCYFMQEKYGEIEIDLRLYLIYKDMGFYDIW